MVSTRACTAGVEGGLACIMASLLRLEHSNVNEPRQVVAVGAAAGTSNTTTVSVTEIV